MNDIFQNLKEDEISPGSDRGLKPALPSMINSYNYQTRYNLFLERLREARIESKLTQLEVAQKLNQPQSYISRCKSSQRRIDVVELLDFATIYRKPITFFIKYNLHLCDRTSQPKNF